MRRKSKYITNGAAIGFFGVSAIDILAQWLEHLRNNKPFTWESYNGTRTIKNALIGGAVGAGVGYLYYDYKISEEKKFPINPDNFLKKILSQEQLKTDPELFNSFLALRNNVKQWAANKFKSTLVSSPEDTGSFFKRTAIASNFDMDIILPFKKYGYSSLQEMYYHVYEELRNEFSHIAQVSKQTKAIGLTFEDRGELLHFDVVPGREIRNYKTKKDLNLYVRPDLIWQRGSSFKTNVNSQKTIPFNSPSARRTIKLLKAYRDRNNLFMPSVIIEHCVCEALSKNYYGSSYSETDNLLNSMLHLAKKLGNETLVDLSNTNNNLMSSIPTDSRYNIAQLLANDVKKIENNPHYIREVFSGT